MRIALSTPAWPGGSTANGITTSVSMLAEGLHEIGHEVIIISFSPYDGPERNVVTLPAPRRWSLAEKIAGRLGHDRATARVLSEQMIHAAQTAVRDHGADVILMEESFGWAGQVQQALDRPVVAVLHGPYFIVKDWETRNYRKTPLGRDREFIEGEGLAACAGIIGLAPHTMTQTLARYDLAHKPHVIIPNAIKVGSRLDYGALSEVARRNLLFVGRFDIRKGGDVTLAMFSEMVSNGADVTLTFVGPDPGVTDPAGQTRHMAEALALLPKDVSRRITYKGLCSKQEIATLRQQHGVAIVASGFETFCYTLVESMAVGVATVATAAGAMTDIVKHDETGLLTPVGDPAAMAAACMRLVSDPSLCARLGANAHADMVANYSPAQIAARIVAFMERLRA